MVERVVLEVMAEPQEILAIKEQLAQQAILD